MGTLVMYIVPRWWLNWFYWITIKSVSFVVDQGAQLYMCWPVTHFERTLYQRFFSSGELKAATQLVTGQPSTKAVLVGRVASMTSPMQSVTHISERRSCSLRLYRRCWDLGRYMYVSVCNNQKVRWGSVFVCLMCVRRQWIPTNDYSVK